MYLLHEALFGLLWRIPEELLTLRNRNKMEREARSG